MPRPHRVQVAGGLYHVTARSNIGRLACRDDRDRKRFLLLLGATVDRQDWSCRAYCVLSTHYHLFVETPQPDIAAGMQYLNGRYGQWANWNRTERGHIFDARYGAVLVESPGHAAEVHRYIALNPVRAGLVSTPEAWRWSSYAALLGRVQALPLLDVGAGLADFGSTPEEARRRLRSFVADGLLMDAA
ncbi:MAG: transposase [Actinobacteria bacterium]|nr:transposase [Actinomycetota bacterium]